MITLSKLDLSSEQSISDVECLLAVGLGIDQKNTVILSLSLAIKLVELEIDLEVIFSVRGVDHHALVCL